VTTLTVKRSGPLEGETTLPGDKSLSHRALILGALARGRSTVRGWLDGGDTRATLQAVEALGVEIGRDGASCLTIRGGELEAPDRPCDCVNAGTSMRLLAGVLAGQNFDSTLDGSDQLRQRPMRRVTDPLRRMGAQIEDNEGRAPLHIRGSRLHGAIHRLDVASAQVKSALLLAGLHADGPTAIIEPGPSRDHTERLLTAMGAELELDGCVIRLMNSDVELQPLDLTIPGDFSSAAFPMVAALIVPRSDVRLSAVGINRTGSGLLDVLRRMQGDVVVQDVSDQSGEAVGSLRIRASGLRGTLIEGDDVVRTIDEFPVLAVAATQAAGATEVRDAAELRVKEVDRIGLLTLELRKLGAQIEEQPDGFIIEGPARLEGTRVDSHGDHRLGMALAVAGLVAEGETIVENAGCIADSFPGFDRTLTRLGAEVR
jgi:3-phosphoshikimate 1-carboxyvinyltransferase